METKSRTVIVGHIEPREGEFNGATPKGGTTTSNVNGVEWVELVQVTPTLAADWLNRYRFDGQRPLRLGRLERLVLEIKEGRFNTSEIRLVHVEDRAYLTNGQHRLHAVIKTGQSILCTVLHHIGHNMEDVIEDYNRVDTMPARTDAEQLAATGLVGTTGLTPSSLNKLSQALVPIIGGFVGRSFSSSGTDPYAKSMAVRQEAIADFADSAQRFNDALFGCDGALTRRLRQRAVMSVALVTLQEQPDAAYEFWKSTAENDGLRRGDPRHTLLRFLTASTLHSNRGAHTARSVATAWNAYTRGQRPAHLRVTDVMRPILIRGTKHYNGKTIYLPYHREEA